MPTPSPLATLVATLAEVYYRAQQHQQLLSKNEAATRAALIDPILRALGWDTTNVALVEPEHTVENKQSLDYVLKGSTGTIQSVVEAKKLGESLDKLGHVGALIGYAFSLKPTSFFITDGLHWHCYSPEHSHYKPIAIIEIAQEALLSAALQLLQLLDAAHAGHGLLAGSALATALLAAPVPVKPAASKQLNKVLKPASTSAKQYLPLTKELVQQAVHKPKWVCLPNGAEYELKNWRDILLEACQLVLHTRHDLALPILDKAEKKTVLVGWQRPTKGLSYSEILYQNRPAFIYTNYSAADCATNALHISKLLPKSAQVTALSVAFTP
ncbi:MAG: hypothetical protein ACRYFK_05300 [Janthinobacterium lividum]